MQKTDSPQSRFGLDILFLLLLVGLTLAALAAYADASEPFDKTPLASVELPRGPEGSAALTRIIGESTLLAPHVKAENYRYGLKLEEARCSIWIYNRPERGAAPTRSERNRIECAFLQEGR